MTTLPPLPAISPLQLSWEPDRGCWPFSDSGKCPTCGRFTRNRVAHKNDELGWITADCGRCGPVKLEVLGWIDAEGNVL
jgi:hypothetical protein